MTVKLKLAPSLSACPICWQNFISEYNKKWGEIFDNRKLELATEEVKHFDDVNSELQDRWNATLTGESWGDISELVFTTEKNRLLFMLRWS